ncbi:MAG: prepilin-type N-terminal cleavage/methylation domain-containing protein [Selenomonadaceae bacterium]|nr:prepilin-type N-terminal cleavage/methylation domain-containing protein [Selenomonadaceae bacterium]
MKPFENQKGFAAIEIILVLLIISLVTSFALPKISRMLETAQLNYETKKFVSEFYFARSVSKSSQFEPEIFSGSVSGGDGIIFSVASRSYQIKSGLFSIYEKHSLPKKFKIAKIFPKGSTFEVDRKFSDNLIFSNGKNSNGFTYRFESPSEIYLYVKKDTVGRIRISRTND